MVKHELEILIILASIAFLVAVYFSFKLSKETRHEKYWLALAVGFFIFAIHHWMMIPWTFGFIPESAGHIIEQISSITGALLFAYATHGLYSSMREIKKKLK